MCSVPDWTKVALALESFMQSGLIARILLLSKISKH